jgi:hypothetical protein
MIYPNPVAKDFTITILNGQPGKKLISIFDATGKLMYSKEVMSNGGKLYVQLDKTLVSGMYTVQAGDLGSKLIFFK